MSLNTDPVGGRCFQLKSMKGRSLGHSFFPLLVVYVNYEKHVLWFLSLCSGKTKTRKVVNRVVKELYFLRLGRRSEIKRGE
jgi:hypothetical protein